MIKDLDYYLSAIPSPYDENQLDSLELSYQGYRRYFFDLVKENIGRRENNINVQLFPEVITNLNFKSSFIINYLYECTDKISQIYSMDVIKDYVERESKYHYDSEELYKLLFFLESDKWIDSLLPSTVIDEAVLNDSKSLYKEIMMRYDSIVSQIDKSNIPFLMNYFIEFSSVSDFSKMMIKLIKKNVVNVLANQIVKGDRNDNNKKSG